MKLTHNQLIYILFATAGTVLILWHLLSPGYVFTMDFYFGPKINVEIDQGALINTLPFKYILSVGAMITSGWFIQKLILALMFFLLFYFPLAYSNKIFGLARTYGVEYVTSVVYVINPFVYERMLAGQWAVLLGYAFLFPVLAHVVTFLQRQTWNELFKLAGFLFVISAVSTHIFAMVIICLFLAFSITLLKARFNLRLLRKIIVFCIIIFSVCSYWVVPAFKNLVTSQLVVTRFDKAHWEAFKTAGDSKLGGVLGNVIAGYGFWGESEPWSNRFILKDSEIGFFKISLSLFLSLVFIGIVFSVRDVSNRNKALSLVPFLVLSVIFSAGVGESVFKNVNEVVFEHVGIWRGFRDAQKWSAVLVLLYSVFSGLGAYYLVSIFKKESVRNSILYVCISIPILYTPYLLFGFSGQLTNTTFPDSWSGVNTILKSDKNCKSIFLPWHQYYSLGFNNGMLTGNLSSNYFDCQILHGKDMGLGFIQDIDLYGDEYKIISRIVTENDIQSQNITPTNLEYIFRKYGIKYIIFTTDVFGEDPYSYQFLRNIGLKLLYAQEGVYLYSIAL